MFKTNLIAIFAGIVSLSAAACAVEDVDRVEQQAKEAGSCEEPETPEVRSLLDWAGSVTEAKLRSFMPSDVAKRIATKGPYDCLEDLASVRGVGNEMLRRLVDYGQYGGGVSESLYAVIDQPTDGRYDAVIAFHVDDNAQAAAFANGATLAELDDVPGFGPTLAGNLIAARPLGDVRDIDAVSGIGVARLRALTEASVGWTGEAPEVVITYEENLGAIDPDLAALIEGELYDAAYAHRDTSVTFPVRFAALETHSVGGVAQLYVVSYVQMIDPEGGIQLWIWVTIDADFDVQDVYADI